MRNSEESSVHNIDAYTSIKALLPPKQKRGVILIDPAFEVTDEFERIKEGLEIIYKKFSQATTMGWYPIKDYPKVRDFYKSLAGLNNEFQYRFEEINYCQQISRLYDTSKKISITLRVHTTCKED